MSRKRQGWLSGALLLSACAGEPVPAPAHELLLLHTSDLHSQLFPGEFVAGELDQARGLGLAGEPVSFGGLSRIATLIERERSSDPDLLYLDSGDLWQGALVHERYGGRAEMVGVSALGLSAQAVGNHDLDQGLVLLSERARAFASYPLLAANLLPRGEEEPAIRPWLVLHAGTLRVAVIGVANVDSVSALETLAAPPEFAMQLAAEAVQAAIDFVRPASDLIIALTHLGVDRDRELARSTSGLDLVLGGHQHVALDEPLLESDCGFYDASGRGYVLSAYGERTPCTPRPVLIAHSGAFGRYLGRLRLRLTQSPDQGLEIAEHEFVLLPVTADLAAQPAVASALAPFEDAPASPLARLLEPLSREAALGGDSPLGNLVADAARAQAPCDFAIVPSSSLRADLQAGALDAAALYQALPFSDPLLRVQLSGHALATWLETIGERARRFGCRTPVQLSGATLRFACDSQRPPEFSLALDPDAIYGVTTTRYLVESDLAGQSGEVVAETLRDAVGAWVGHFSFCDLADGLGSLPCVDGADAGRIAFEEH